MDGIGLSGVLVSVVVMGVCDGIYLNISDQLTIHT